MTILHNRLKRLEHNFGDALACPVCKGEPPSFCARHNYGEPVPEPTPDQCCPKCGKCSKIVICYKDETPIRRYRGTYTAADLRERMAAQ